MCENFIPCKHDMKHCDMSSGGCYPLCEGYVADPDKIELVPYADLPLGTRFRYHQNGKRYDTVWVKLDHNDKIAKWEGNDKSRWTGQIIASNDPYHPDTRFVEVV